MSTSWQGQEPEPQWNQPPFAPGYQEPEPEEYQNPQPLPPYAATQPYAATPPLPDVVSGSVLVPHAQIPPPGALESALRVLSGVLWPLVIAAMIFGGGSWWFGIIFAIIASGVLRQVIQDLKRRRVHRARIVPPSGQQDLR